MACAGAVGALTALAKTDLNAMEKRMAAWDRAIAAHPAVQRTRRIGAFMAVELDHAEAVQQAVEAGLDRSAGDGVLLFWFLSVPHAFRLAPPLNASDEDMTQGLSLILSALDQVA